MYNCTCLRNVHYMCSVEELGCNTTDVLGLHDANLQHVPVKENYYNSRKESIYMRACTQKHSHRYIDMYTYVQVQT